MRTKRSTIPSVVLEMDLTEGRDLLHLLKMQKLALQNGNASGTSIIDQIDFIDEVILKLEPLTDRMAEEL